MDEVTRAAMKITYHYRAVACGNEHEEATTFRQHWRLRETIFTRKQSRKESIFWEYQAHTGTREAFYHAQRKWLTTSSTINSWAAIASYTQRNINQPCEFILKLRGVMNERLEIRADASMSSRFMKRYRAERHSSRGALILASPAGRYY